MKPRNSWRVQRQSASFKQNPPDEPVAKSVRNEESDGESGNQRVKVRRRRTRERRKKLIMQMALGIVIIPCFGAMLWHIWLNVAENNRREAVVLPKAHTPPAAEAPVADTAAPAPKREVTKDDPVRLPPLEEVLKPHAAPVSVANMALTAPAPKPTFFDIIHPENEEAEKAVAMRVFDDFRQAATWQEKLKFVRQPERVRPLMQNYYETHHRVEPETDGQRAGIFVRGTGAGLLHVAFPGKTSDEMTYADMVHQPDGAYLLDWESFVGAGVMDWEDFKKARPTQPQLMRVVLSESDYYNYEFTDKARYLGLWLVSRDGELSVHAFCERESDIGLKIAAHLKTLRRGVNRATVRIAFPEKAQSDSCVLLTELVADRWLVLE